MNSFNPWTSTLWKLSSRLNNPKEAHEQLQSLNINLMKIIKSLIFRTFTQSFIARNYKACSRLSYKTPSFTKMRIVDTNTCIKETEDDIKQENISNKKNGIIIGNFCVFSKPIYCSAHTKQLSCISLCLQLDQKVLICSTLQKVWHRWRIVHKIQDFENMPIRYMYIPMSLRLNTRIEQTMLLLCICPYRSGRSLNFALPFSGNSTLSIFLFLVTCSNIQS